MLVLGIIIRPIMEVSASSSIRLEYQPQSNPVSAAVHSRRKCDHSNMYAHAALSAVSS